MQIVHLVQIVHPDGARFAGPSDLDEVTRGSPKHDGADAHHSRTAL